MKKISLLLTRQEILLLRRALGVAYAAKIEIIEENELKLSHKAITIIEENADALLCLNKEIKKQHFELNINSLLVTKKAYKIIKKSLNIAYDTTIEIAENKKSKLTQKAIVAIYKDAEKFIFLKNKLKETSCVL